MSQIFNIFPTTIYVGEVENHNEYKTEFLKLYDKFDYEENEISSTVSEGQVHPLIPVSYTHLTLPTTGSV